MTRDVTAILPVKPWRLSKSRLDLPGEARSSLARAFTLDVVEAVAASSRVGRLILVSAEMELHVVARSRRAIVLADRPTLSSDGLNEAVARGHRWAAVRRADSPVLVLPADLPALTTGALDATIDLFGSADTAFVPDTLGQGTTALWARSPHLLTSAYGAGSARSHAAAGARAVSGADPRIRLDVDTVDDLAAARRLGVGPQTLEALASIAAGDRSGRLCGSR